MSLWTALRSRMGVKGLGWLPNDDDTRDLSMHRLALAESPPVRASLEHFLPGILDQGATSSCVAQALAGALRIAHAVRGEPIELVSRLYLYSNARHYTGDERRDDGTYPRNAMRGLVKYGAPPESEWPFLARMVNQAPSWNAYRAGFDARGPRAYYWIQSSGNARLNDVRRAIASGYPVTFGMRVDDAFLDPGGGFVVDAPSGPMVGGHAMFLIGYEGELFRVVNSWGSGWRDGGRCWVTSEVVAACMSDLGVIEL